MGEALAFVSIDVWTLIFSWVNLLILFLLMKKFLFKPVKNIIDQRQNEIEKMYTDAETKNEEAKNLKEDLEKRLSSAKDEAAKIVKDATKNAALSGEKILKDANDEARRIKENARIQIEEERKASFEDAKEDIASMAVSIAEKVLEKKIEEENIEDIVEKSIEKLGESR